MHINNTLHFSVLEVQYRLCLSVYLFEKVANVDDLGYNFPHIIRRRYTCSLYLQFNRVPFKATIILCKIFALYVFPIPDNYNFNLFICMQI